MREGPSTQRTSPEEEGNGRLWIYRIISKTGRQTNGYKGAENHRSHWQQQTITNIFILTNSMTMCHFKLVKLWENQDFFLTAQRWLILDVLLVGPHQSVEDRYSYRPFWGQFSHVTTNIKLSLIGISPWIYVGMTCPYIHKNHQ